MAALMPRSRISSLISRTMKPNRQSFSSNVASGPSKETIISSQSIISEQAAVDADYAATSAAAIASEPPLDAAAASVAGKKSWGFLKYGLIAALTGATGVAGYATYAYSSDEVDHRTKALRESVNYKVPEDASEVEKYKGLIYTTAMTVPAKAVEIYLDVRRLVEEQISGFTEPTSDKLLPDLHPSEQHVFTLVLDLTETLTYTDWNREKGWRTLKRPGVQDFLQHVGKFYEIVVFSDQLNMFVDPVIEALDPDHYVRYRLARGATKYMDGKHYRDLSKLNRDPKKVLYVSAHAFENCLQPENCVPIKPFKYTDSNAEDLDTALLDLIPFLEYVAQYHPADIRAVLQSYKREDISKEFLERNKELQKRMEEQKRHQGRLWRR